MLPKTIVYKILNYFYYFSQVSFKRISNIELMIVFSSFQVLGRALGFQDNNVP